MAKVLTQGSKVKCGTAAPHVGTLSVPGAGLLTVDGVEVLTKALVESPVPPERISGCTNQTSNTTKCTAVVSVSEGVATRLFVEGEPVVLDSLVATTNSTPSPSSVSVIDAANDLLRAE